MLFAFMCAIIAYVVACVIAAIAQFRHPFIFATVVAIVIGILALAADSFTVAGS